MSIDLKAEYDKLKAQGEVLAGDLLEIPRRVAILTHLYFDSGCNHAFSLIAAHGALWGLAYFESGGSLGRFVAKRYFYNRQEKAYRLGILREFAEGFRRVNRQVCIDTYANYHFVKRFGKEPHADAIIPSNLLDALDRVHHARTSGKPISGSEKKQVFENSFRCEQEVTVAPGVQQAIAEFDCPIMRWLCLHPVVRFTYFPRFRYFLFHDFGRTEERIEKGLRAFDFAERAGWDTVFDSLDYYGQMPRSYFNDPTGHFESLRANAIRQGQIAVSMDL
ncbi:MAG: hypothetical protein R3E01_33950 [Pirellulaceae bacterium]|nr:hypothetical protein [Planctomycetales bacterium]